MIKKRASQTFINVVADGAGSIVGDCELCGRTYFDPCDGGYEDGELEELERKAKKEPDKYVPCDGGVSLGSIAGNQVVLDCDCPGLANYENFIWNDRFKIAEYLKARLKNNLEKAQAESETLSGL